MSQRLPAVDQYIANAKPFAQPILIHLREAMHRVVPDLEEQLKWSRPFFVYKGVILGHISAFKQHCSLGLWGGDMAQALRADGISSSEGMGSFGRIASLEDLPSTAELEGYIQHAASLINEGKRTKSIQRVAKLTRTEIKVPEALSTALQANKAVADRFAKLSPSCRREYTDWIASAKREETRAKRVATALQWIAEGKNLNWKYERSA